jgi:hypothetical protein
MLEDIELNSAGKLVEDLDSTLFGPMVKVVRTLYTGDTVEEAMPAALAVDAVLRDPINGCGEVVSARIVWPKDQMDYWGGSM